METHKHMVLVPIDEYNDMLASHQKVHTLIKSVTEHLKLADERLGTTIEFNLNLIPKNVVLVTGYSRNKLEYQY